MKSIVLGVCIALVVVGAMGAQNSRKSEKSTTANPPIASAIDRGAHWLASVQGRDGGWGRMEAKRPILRSGERLESNGNDVALIRRSQRWRYWRLGPSIVRMWTGAVEFILKQVDARVPTTAWQSRIPIGTQIQRKLDRTSIPF
jgi:hypothetical protein